MAILASPQQFFEPLRTFQGRTYKLQYSVLHPYSVCPRTISDIDRDSPCNFPNENHKMPANEFYQFHPRRRSLLSILRQSLLQRSLFWRGTLQKLEFVFSCCFGNLHLLFCQRNRFLILKESFWKYFREII